MYDIREKKAYVYCTKSDCKFETFCKWIIHLESWGLFKGHRSAVATIFLEPNPTSLSIASILCEPDYIPYWKAISLINTSDILSAIQEKILPEEEFEGTAIQQINKGLEFHFFVKECQPEKKLIIITKDSLHSCEVYVLNQRVKEIYLPFSIEAIERTLSEIINIIRYVFSVKICHGQSTIGNLSIYFVKFCYISLKFIYVIIFFLRF
jgi:hypothetical protein